MGYLDKARIILLLFRSKLDRYEKDTFGNLAYRWNPIADQLRKQLEELASKGILSDNQVFLQNQYQDFLRQTESLIGTYNAYALGQITQSQEYFGNLGIQSSQKMLEITYRSFPRINIDAVNAFIGMSLEGAPIVGILEKSFPEMKGKIVDTITKGLALGWNSDKTARILSKTLDIPYYRAVRVARTESFNAYRLSSIESYKASGLCQGWIRSEAPDCCPECVPLDGKKYSLDEPYEAHVNCRMASIPWLK